MNIAILTSSRADYGIYLPLLKAIKKEHRFTLKIIAFGTHLSKFHGYTIDQIINDGFGVEEALETLILGDTEEAVSNAIGNTIIKFSSLWKRLKKEVDIVFALGDRYEMFAAVSASVPFNIPIAHIHGGETTLGAIDNKFRHAITLMADYHFASTEEYVNRITQLVGHNRNVYNVGALSLDNLLDLELWSVEAFEEKWNINLRIPTILTTFHPETVSTEKNEIYAVELVNALRTLSLDYQIVITMPNADTMGMIIRKELEQLVQENTKVIGIENFGTLGYFSCIKHCAFLVGNTSSGIIEAASFGKYVVNLGDRQKGRARSENILDVAVTEVSILRAAKSISEKKYKGGNIYQPKVKSSDLIMEKISQLFDLENTNNA